MQARLIYVVGASGSGKDTLMAYARNSLANEDQVVFAHRYITRAADAGGENHVALTPDEFESRRRAGLLAMHWQSHGYAYGIGIEINQWLAKGITVVVNGSRQYLETAAQRYCELLPVSVEVMPDVLRARLLARGRESATEIDQRLARAPQTALAVRRGKVIHNDGELRVAGDALIDFIRGCYGATCTMPNDGQKMERSEVMPCA
ncbi:MAG: phosphonate metabolism protein/1,5-bisphosphokinase (PRPP-forming) PhnN [Hydrogenophilales bacterium CG_4_10_14_0_8_um_filter_62_70]|nr:MAG: phosphonate metabolism protein/1,5-bisphosphokinase (PRPP-forming) PhnN [Hydrogenophilales bacterium CG_4_10_14_0_8_um_filter_62_70]